MLLHIQNKTHATQKKKKNIKFLGNYVLSLIHMHIRFRGNGALKFMSVDFMSMAKPFLCCFQ